jgi:ABC-type multidrug transport system fused ATPase/permease subunit
MQQTFLSRQAHFQQRADAAQRQYNTLAIWRLTAFLVTVLLVWVLVQSNQTTVTIGVGLAGLAAFLWLLKRHQAVGRERDLHRNRVFINQDESARLDRKYLRPETGVEFLNPNHPYSGDLDVFGPHSLFRLLNRTHTHAGRQRLANWLQQLPTDLAQIHFRQQATAEVLPQTDWRQDLEAYARQNEHVGQNQDNLRRWAADNTPLPGWLSFVRVALPLLTITLIALWLAGVFSGYAVLFSLALHGLVLRQIVPQAKQASEQTHNIAAALSGFRDMFVLVENVEGNSPLIRNLRQSLKTGPKSASVATARLASLVENFNFRRNPYFMIFVGVLLLWDVQYLLALNQWQKQHGPTLPQWFDTLAEAEALNSLAGFSFAHPTYTTPNLIEDDGLSLEATDAAHPLIRPDKAVANSLTLNGPGQTILITGSNMSGKSTFLRTLGANVVLALSGAVVSAERFSCSPVRVFTSMRTQDSLEESTSSFYAELKRLQALIQQTETEKAVPVLYFLDEILKGTNSADRHRGAEALIRQLHKTTASGFVSTHDLELGVLADDTDFVQNFHFQSDFQDGKLLFDYRLRDGLCHSFNASQLMRSIGIDL